MSVASPSPSQIIQVPRNPCTIGARSLFKLMNDRSPFVNEARRYLEQNTRTRDQCLAVLKDADPSNFSCWICGGRFSHLTRQVHCEHILPVAQGVIFLELYSRHHPDTISEAMKVEYAWAHNVCNLKKGKMVLIKQVGDSFFPDEDAIRKVLTSINADPAFVTDRTDKMKEQLKKVTDYINSSPDTFVDGLVRCEFPATQRRIDFTGRGRKSKRKHNGTLRRTTRQTTRTSSWTHRKFK